MKQYNFKRAGRISIVFAFFILIASSGSIWFSIIGAVTTSYIFIHLKMLLNYYKFSTPDKLIICLIVISLLQPMLFFFPQDYALTFILVATTIKGLSFICLGISMFYLKESLFGYKKILGSILAFIGVFYIHTGLSPKLGFISTCVPKNTYWGFVILTAIFHFTLYLILGAILLKADKIRYIKDTGSTAY